MSNNSWKNWSDHPYIVAIVAIASIVTILGFVYTVLSSGKSNSGISINVEGANVEGTNIRGDSAIQDRRMVQSNDLQNNSMTAPPRLHTYVSPLMSSESECSNSLKTSLRNYGLHNIVSVQQGVYGTKGSYNIFVGCYEEVKAIFLVVSGPEDSNAKKIREEIKALLP